MPDSGYPDPIALAETIIIEAPPLEQHDFAPAPCYSGWEPYQAGLTDPAYWVDGFGLCHLRGVAWNGGPSFLGSYILAPLPSPIDNTDEPWLVGGAAGWAVVSVVYDDANAAGALRYDLGSLDPGAFVYLSGITYPT